MASEWREVESIPWYGGETDEDGLVNPVPEGEVEPMACCIFEQKRAKKPDGTETVQYRMRLTKVLKYDEKTDKVLADTDAFELTDVDMLLELLQHVKQYTERRVLFSAFGQPTI